MRSQVIVRYAGFSQELDPAFKDEKEYEAYQIVHPKNPTEYLERKPGQGFWPARDDIYEISTLHELMDGSRPVAMSSKRELDAVGETTESLKAKGFGIIVVDDPDAPDDPSIYVYAPGEEYRARIIANNVRPDGNAVLVGMALGYDLADIRAYLRKNLTYQASVKVWSEAMSHPDVQRLLSKKYDYAAALREYGFV